MIALERARRWVYRRQMFQSLGFPASPLRRPIFLVGTVRSGTTYLGRCLGDHPQVINAGFELSQEWYELAGLEIATPGLPCVHCPPAVPEAVAGREEQVRAGFAQLHMDKGGWRGTRLFNKSPHLWNKLPLVRALFPDAVLLISSRDVWSTVASTKRLWEKVARDRGIKHYLSPKTRQHVGASRAPTRRASFRAATPLSSPSTGCASTRLSSASPEHFRPSSRCVTKRSWRIPKACFAKWSRRRGCGAPPIRSLPRCRKTAIPAGRRS